MQSFNTFGFTMEYAEGEHEKFADVKAAIENLCKESEKYSNLYEKNPLIHYIQIDVDIQYIRFYIPEAFICNLKQSIILDIISV